MTERRYRHDPGKGMFVEIVDEQNNVLDLFFFHADTKISVDVHGNDSYAPIRSNEDEALSTASDMIKEMAYLEPDALKFLIKTINDELSSRRESIEEFVKKHNITISCTHVYRNPYMMEFEGDHWEVILTMPGKRTNRLMSYFSKGFGHKGKEPTAEEVLDCLASEASGYENAKQLKDWACEYGYDPNSKQTETIYRNVVRETTNLKQFLGNENYNKLLWNTEQM